MKTKLEELLGNVSVLVVLLPALVFLMAFAFQLGYFGYSNIPLNLITIRTQEIAIVKFQTCYLEGGLLWQYFWFLPCFAFQLDLENSLLEGKKAFISSMGELTWLVSQ